MEIISFRGSLRKYWSRRRGYNNRSYTNRKTMKVVKLGSVKSKRSWKVRIAPKLRLAVRMASPIKLWHVIKNAYMDMMLGLANSTGAIWGAKTYGTKRTLSHGRGLVPKGCSEAEFENRLVFEIYKSMMASSELGCTPVKLINV